MKIALFIVLLIFVLTGCRQTRENSFPPFTGNLSSNAHESQRNLTTPHIESTQPNAHTIRVVISTSGFTGLVHESLVITGTGDFTVTGGGSIAHFAAGDAFTVSQTKNADLWGDTRLVIAPVDPENHRLAVVGLARNWTDQAQFPGVGQSPLYRGVLEISRNKNGHGNGQEHMENGGFVLVNELCMEAYLYAVIPGEMPAAHGFEAAKVQAVTARSFALQRLSQRAFEAFGAHVCDSVISQVYNNVPETAMSVAAVEATRGLVLAVDGVPVSANYFSTSGGTTANFGEVWAQGSRFPGESPTHLQAAFQFNAQSPLDLSQEAYAAAFFRSHNIPAFDREFPWFRWEVRLTAAALSQGINAAIGTRQGANPALVQALDDGGNPTEAAVTGIGQLTNLEVTRRGQGGNVMAMILTGTTGAALVQTEFNIRTLLRPGSAPLTRHDGSVVSNLQLLPSAFFTFEVEKDPMGHVAAITFFGGGNGHGVGMSQNGAGALAKMDLSYREILGHFYAGAEVIPLQSARHPW